MRGVLLSIACGCCTVAAIAVTMVAASGFPPPSRPLVQRLGYPADTRLLIIHADDFGMAESVDRAIESALTRGWVTSASMMVPCPWFPEAAAWARRHPNADIGIHLVLDSEWSGYRWGPVAPADMVPTLLDPQGYFFDDPSLFTHVRLSDVRTELRAQIDRARAQGVHVSHLDSHMIALTTTRGLFGVYQALGHQYDVPIQLIRPPSDRMPEGVVPARDALALDGVITMSPGVSKGDWVGWYEKRLAALRPGVYQLIVHLAYDDEEFAAITRGHPEWGAQWRQQDLDMVSSPAFQQFLRRQKFKLVTWGELAKAYQERVGKTL